MFTESECYNTENGISSFEAEERERNVGAFSSVRKETGCSRKAAWMNVAKSILFPPRNSEKIEQYAKLLYFKIFVLKHLIQLLSDCFLLSNESVSEKQIQTLNGKFQASLHLEIMR